MEQLHMVYTLIDNGRVFYIGCTKNIHNRYIQHLRGDIINATYFYIQDMLVNSQMPEIKIVACLPENEAYFREAQLIVTFRDCGHQLCNDVRNSYFNKLHPLRHPMRMNKKITKDKAKELKSMQIDAIKSYYNKFQPIR